MMILPAVVTWPRERLMRGHLSIPPMTGSSDAITAIVSAIRLSFISSPTSWRFTNDGSWIFIRNGWSVPSEMA